MVVNCSVLVMQSAIEMEAGLPVVEVVEEWNLLREKGTVGIQSQGSSRTLPREGQG